MSKVTNKRALALMLTVMMVILQVVPSLAETTTGLKTIEIRGEDAINLDGTADYSTVYESVYSVDGAKQPAVDDVVWSLTKVAESDKVKIDNTGKLTVAKDAKADTVEIKAESTKLGLLATKSVEIKVDVPVEPKKYILKVDKTDVEVKDEVLSYKVPVKLIDENGNSIDVSEKDLTFEEDVTNPLPNGVVLENGTFKITHKYLAEEYEIARFKVTYKGSLNCNVKTVESYISIYKGLLNDFSIEVQDLSIEIYPWDDVNIINPVVTIKDKNGIVLNSEKYEIYLDMSKYGYMSRKIDYCQDKKGNSLIQVKGIYYDVKEKGKIEFVCVALINSQSDKRTYFKVTITPKTIEYKLAKDEAKEYTAKFERNQYVVEIPRQFKYEDPRGTISKNSSNTYNLPDELNSKLYREINLRDKKVLEFEPSLEAKTYDIDLKVANGFINDKIKLVIPEKPEKIEKFEVEPLGVVKVVKGTGDIEIQPLMVEVRGDKGTTVHSFIQIDTKRLSNEIRDLLKYYTYDRIIELDSSIKEGSYKIPFNVEDVYGLTSEFTIEVVNMTEKGQLKPASIEFAEGHTFIEAGKPIEKQLVAKVFDFDGNEIKQLPQNAKIEFGLTEEVPGITLTNEGLLKVAENAEGYAQIYVCLNLDGGYIYSRDFHEVEIRPYVKILPVNDIELSQESNKVYIDIQDIDNSFFEAYNKEAIVYVKENPTLSKKVQLSNGAMWGEIDITDILAKTNGKATLVGRIDLTDMKGNIIKGKEVEQPIQASMVIELESNKIRVGEKARLKTLTFVDQRDKSVVNLLDFDKFRGNSVEFDLYEIKGNNFINVSEGMDTVVDRVYLNTEKLKDGNYRLIFHDRYNGGFGIDDLIIGNVESIAAQDKPAQDKPSSGGGGGGGSISSNTSKSSKETADSVKKALKDEAKEIKVSIADAKDHKALFNKDTLKDIVKAEKPVTIDNKDVKLIFNSKVFDLENVSVKQELQISANKVEKQEATKLVEKAIKANKDVRIVGADVFDFKMKLVENGVKDELISKFSKSVEVVVDLSKAQIDEKDYDKLSGIRLEENKDGSVTPVQLGGTYDQKAKTFTFKTDHFSFYTVAVVEKTYDKVIEIKIGNKFGKVNDKSIELDVAPLIVEGRTIVPLRFVSESLGADVDWNAISRTATIKLGDKESLVKMDGNPFVKVVNDRILVPFRYVSEELGAEVEWNEETRTVTIRK